MTLPRRKTLVYFALSLALFAVAVFWVGAAEAHAASTVWDNVKGLATRALGGGADIGIALAIAYVVLLLIFEVASYVLAFAGLFLDVLFGANILLTPGINPVVLVGWTALRDLANGLFILIVLWIAITIIFNLESWGGKRLLVRVIVVALLINFSLLMASTVFAFTNQLALPFARAMGLDPYNPQEGITLSTIFIKETKLHEVAAIIRKEGATEQFKQSVKQAAAPPASQEEIVAGPATLWAASIPQSLGIAPPVPTAQADVPTGAAAGWLCFKAIGLLSTFTGVIPAVACGAVGVAVGAFVNVVDVASVAGPTVGAVAGWVLTPYINLAIADIFLLVTAVAFFSAAVLLAVRYIAMMFLGVFAPVAFLGLVVPRYGERVWNLWLDNLFRWAFVAPIFYFLMYLSVYMLQAISSAQSSFAGSDKVAFQGNALKIFSLMIFLVFLWASIFLTRKAAGMGAEAALTFGKKLAGVGLGVGTGLFARAALPRLGRLATGLQEKINQGPALVRSTFGRGLAAYGLRRVTGASRQQVVDAESRISRMGLTSAEIQQGLASGRFRTQADVAGAVRVLQKSRDLKPVAGVRGYDDTHVRKAADTMRDLQLEFIPFLRANPTIATDKDFGPSGVSDEKAKVLSEEGRTIDDAEATRRLAWKLIRPGDLENMDLGIFKDNDNAKRTFLEFATGDHFSRLGRLNTAVAQDIQTYLEQPANRHIWDSFSDAKKRYFSSSTAQSIGVWRVPPYPATGGTGGAPTGSGGGGTAPPGGGTPPPGGGPTP